MLSSGYGDYISKPIQYAELCAILRRWLPPPGSSPEDAVPFSRDETLLVSMSQR